ncbi:MAG: hypothetical protein N4A33_10590 [Bacteriovoracaceae bacterium]|jgi:hypothetical protein|nr:hypothetical protein [Bacteriovoracaceae bacterium]
MKITKEQLDTFFDKFEMKTNEQISELIAGTFEEDAAETFIDHIEDFYGIEDDEEVALLAQLMITGFLAGKSV